MNRIFNTESINLSPDDNPHSALSFNAHRSTYVVNRTLFIFVDGACSNNGRDDSRASFGVWFGPSSRYNSSAVLDCRAHRQTSQYAELFAIVRALRIVRFHADDRFGSIRNVVIVTDSEYATRCMTEWILKWSQNGWRNVRGGTVVNGGMIRKLDGMIHRLEREHEIRVLFWKVGRRFNTYADALAKNV